MYSKGWNSELERHMAVINNPYPIHCSHMGCFKKTKSKFFPFSLNISATKIRAKKSNDRPNANLFGKVKDSVIVLELKSKR
jgi:hypothetical protein